jgi:hypothetical protein
LRAAHRSRATSNLTDGRTTNIDLVRYALEPAALDGVSNGAGAVERAYWKRSAGRDDQVTWI